MGYINLGSRNKPTAWEYGSPYSFLHTKLPTKVEIPHFFSFAEGELNQHCHKTEDIEKSVRLMIEEFEAGTYNSQFFKKIIKIYTDSYKKTAQICKSDFKKDSNKDLAKKFQEATTSFFEANKPMLFAIYSMYFDEYFTKELKKVLSVKEQADEQNLLQIKTLLLTPTKATFPQLEEEALITLAKEYLYSVKKANKESFDSFFSSQILETLSKKFGWFHMEYHQEAFTPFQYKNYLWELVQNPEIKLPSQIREAVKSKQAQFFKTHKNSQKLKKLSLTLQEFAYILDHTKMIIIKGIFNTRPIYREVSKRLETTEKDLRYLVFPEVVELLKTNKKADQKLIKERKQYRSILVKGDQILVYEGEKAKKIAEKLLGKQQVTNVSEVQGVIAYPGKITGRVGLIHSSNDTFQAGDILVTHDGTAELTTFLKQASAIVTDQGGMICHAAIIAREMKTPAVLGTGIATRVFKQGDLVEVDAEKGVVRRITN